MALNSSSRIPDIGTICVKAETILETVIIVINMYLRDG